MKTKIKVFLFFLFACVAVSLAADARQMFREPRYTRGNENMRFTSPLDEAAWIAHPDAREGSAPVFFRFRKTFVAEGAPLRFDVSADERFILLLDGEEISRGPHRGMVTRWFYQTYEIPLAAGEHTLEAVVWRLGEFAPAAQLSFSCAFVLKAEGVYDSALTTGKAAWKTGRLCGTTPHDRTDRDAFAVGGVFEVRGAGVAAEEPVVWTDPVTTRAALKANTGGGGEDGWICFPTEIPDQLHARCTPGAFRTGADAAAFNRLLAGGGPITLPPNTKTELYWDLGNYYCAYPEVVVSGGKGGRIEWGWAESLRGPDGKKGNRAEWDGKRFAAGMTDTFLPDGRARAVFTVPWWRAGRWCRLAVETGDEPLAVNALAVYDTRYPLKETGSFVCDDPSLDAVQKLCTRGLGMCMHEMFMDCPYYEQQMYPGDSRTEFFAAAALDSDDRLVRQLLGLFACAQRDNGLVPMNYPSRFQQDGCTYSMLWGASLGDASLWRDCAPWLRAQMPAFRKLLFALALRENADGLLADLPGWSFTDWCGSDGWVRGVAPDGNAVSSVNNLQYLIALQGAVAAEAALGEKALAAYWRGKAERLARTIERVYWNDARGMLADDCARTRFSEHGLSLALLSDALPREKAKKAFDALVSEKDLARTSVYFSHYLFEAYLKFGRADLFLKRLDLWRDYVKLGLSTPLEEPGESRSDCHAWGAHPLHQLHHGVAGVKPAEPFFRSVLVAPVPGPLTWIKAKTPHPKGVVETDLVFEAGRVTGSVTLPPGVPGTFVWKEKKTPLKPGARTVIE